MLSPVHDILIYSFIQFILLVLVLGMSHKLCLLQYYDYIIIIMVILRRLWSMEHIYEVNSTLPAPPPHSPPSHCLFLFCTNMQIYLLILSELVYLLYELVHRVAAENQLRLVRCSASGASLMHKPYYYISSIKLVTFCNYITRNSSFTCLLQ